MIPKTAFRDASKKRPTRNASAKRREFTVLGDVVNTASRIEGGVAQPDQIVISKNTRDRIGHAFDVRSLGGITLRGRDTELECFEVIG